MRPYLQRALWPGNKEHGICGSLFSHLKELFIIKLKSRERSLIRGSEKDPGVKEDLGKALTGWHGGIRTLFYSLLRGPKYKMGGLLEA